MTEERRGIEEQMKFAQESESEGIKQDERTRYQDIQKEERMKEQEELKKEIAEVCQARMKMEETIKVLYNMHDYFFSSIFKSYPFIT